MKQKFKPFPIFFAAVFGLFSLLLIPLAGKPYLFTTESVFLSPSNKITLKQSFFSALPYTVLPPRKHASIAKTDEVLVPKLESFDTFRADPPVVSGSLQIKNNTSYTPNINELLQKQYTFKSKNPTVLIVHTHTSEAYAQSEAFDYIPSDSYRTEDPNRNICLVGDRLSETLEKRGISVIHDTTSHDYPSYSGCYSRSLETVEKRLAENPSIEIVIDLHRDAISDENGNYLKTYTKIDGKDCAQAVIIIGTDAGGLPHSGWEENLSLGLKLQETMCQNYPSLARPLQLRSERFNGHASRGALLIEIGSNANTMEEALYCAELVANALAETILAEAD